MDHSPFRVSSAALHCGLQSLQSTFSACGEPLKSTSPSMPSTISPSWVFSVHPFLAAVTFVKRVWTEGPCGWLKFWCGTWVAQWLQSQLETAAATQHSCWIPPCKAPLQPLGTETPYICAQNQLGTVSQHSMPCPCKTNFYWVDSKDIPRWFRFCLNSKIYFIYSVVVSCCLIPIKYLKL